MFCGDQEGVGTLCPPCTQATFKSPAPLGLTYIFYPAANRVKGRVKKVIIITLVETRFQTKGVSIFNTCYVSSLQKTVVNQSKSKVLKIKT